MDFERHTTEKEPEPERLFKLLLVRHEHTDYEEEDPGLTEGGKRAALEKGGAFMEEHDLNETNLHILHSPQKRAKETAEAIAAGSKVQRETRSIDQLRTADKGENYDEFTAAAMRHVDKDGEVDEIAMDKITADQYGDGELYTNRPDVVETKEDRSKRLYRSLEYLIRWYEGSDTQEKENVLAVSHFEIIMHIIDDAFGIENFDSHHQPNFGDHLEIEAFKTGNENNVRLHIKYLDKETTVLFDRTVRSVTKI